jgi:haloalkane dehalogenase
MRSNPSTPHRPPAAAQGLGPALVQHLGEGDERIAYIDDGEGPAALFVHVGLWSYLWRDVIGQLRTEFRCVAPDAPASGRSGGEPRHHATLDTAAARLSDLVETLDLRDVTLVFHDLGGPVAVLAAGRWAERVRGLVAVNTFAWRPDGLAFRGLLATMGSAPIRTLDVATGVIPRLSSTRFGTGRHLDRAGRREFRSGLDRRGRSSFHRYFADARRTDIWPRTESALGRLREHPLTTVFGERNDPLRFQPQWLARFPQANQLVVPRGHHFPMCDDPAAVAAAVRSTLRS